MTKDEIIDAHGLDDLKATKLIHDIIMETYKEAKNSLRDFLKFWVSRYMTAEMYTALGKSTEHTLTPDDF